MPNNKLTFGEFVSAVYETAERQYPGHSSRAVAKIVSGAVRRGILRFENPDAVRRLMRKSH